MSDKITKFVAALITILVGVILSIYIMNIYIIGYLKDNFKKIDQRLTVIERVYKLDREEAKK